MMGIAIYSVNGNFLEIQQTSLWYYAIVQNRNESFPPWSETDFHDRIGFFLELENLLKTVRIKYFNFPGWKKYHISSIRTIDNFLQILQRSRMKQSHRVVLKRINLDIESITNSHVKTTRMDIKEHYSTHFVTFKCMDLRTCQCI